MGGDPIGTSVIQSVEGNPSVFFLPTINAQGGTFNFTVRVNGTGDDDFFGFVIGYEVGDLGSTSTDFLLFDWKQNTQFQSSCLPASVNGLRGTAISRVTSATAPLDFWCKEGGVEILAKGDVRGFLPWVQDVDYAFEVTFESDLLEVSIDGLSEISLTAAQAGVASFADGRFGFYTYSQDNVVFSEVEIVAPPVASVPALSPLGLVLLLVGITAWAGRTAMGESGTSQQH